MMLTTPPTAMLPQVLDAPPRMTSMWSMDDMGTLNHCVVS